jgi:hypothetical protein
MLRQRLDRNERFERLGALPVVGQLVGVQRRPLTDESEGTRRQRAVENLERAQLDLGDILSVLRVEVRRRMVRPGTSRSRSRRTPPGEAPGDCRRASGRSAVGRRQPLTFRKCRKSIIGEASECRSRVLSSAGRSSASSSGSGVAQVGVSRHSARDVGDHRHHRRGLVGRGCCCGYPVVLQLALTAHRRAAEVPR